MYRAFYSSGRLAQAGAVLKHLWSLFGRVYNLDAVERKRAPVA